MWSISDAPLTRSTFAAVSAYSMDKKAFELPAMPPALLGTRAHNELSHGPVSRLVSALYTHYDDLQFGALSWAYWHAVCAPLHIAAVHFGAAIEALQRRYLAIHSGDFATKIVSTNWDNYANAIGSTIDASGASDEIKGMLKSNIGLLNQVPRRILTDQIIVVLGLDLGDDERKAWKRRHDAAHGNDITPGTELAMIRDTKLLKVLFHRMLLGIVNGSDIYYDYASLNFPLRRLDEAVPSLP